MLDLINPLFALLIVDGVCTYICFRDGKTGLGLVGVAGFAAAPLLVWFPLYGALSSGARPVSVTRPGSTPATAEPRTESGDSDPVYSELVFSGISRFLDEALRSGAVDQLTYDHLTARLDVGAWTAEPIDAAEPSEPEAASRPASVSEIEPTTLTWETPTAAMGPPPPATTIPPDGPRRSTPRPPPGELRQMVDRFWDALSSEVALHGFAYLGVLMTFVAVLGFLLFAFVDVPDTQQPIYELGIAVIFFAWSWFLRRQNAVHAAAGMELIGGMVLPLAVFASLVDNAPVPPDFEGRPLVLALTVISILLATGYAWHTSRKPYSTLKYLVAPLLWLAALVLGFWFKTDELLTSDAITRLVSPQPSMAASAISLTLFAAWRNRKHRLAVPTVRSALVGVPVAYLLTVSLAVGEDWARAWPLALLGASTLVSVEIMAGWFDKSDLLTSLRPLLLGVMLVTVTPSLPFEWAGLITVVSYVALLEYQRSLSGKVTPATLLIGAGVVVGFVMTFGAPWPALLASVGLTVWAHLRRHSAWGSSAVREALTVLAASAPLATGAALLGLTSAAVAVLIMSAVLVTATVTVRATGSTDAFWPYWLTGAAVPVLGLTLGGWQRGEVALEAPLAMVMVAVAVGVAPRWPTFRLWLGSGVSIAALVIAMETPARPGLERVWVWAIVGVGLIAVATIVRRPPASHIAAIGHVVTLVAFSSVDDRAGPALAWVAWAVGWVLSEVASEQEGETLTGLFRRLIERMGERPGSPAVRSVAWFVPVVMTLSIPPAVVAVATLWGADRPGSGVLVALVGLLYASAARLWAIRRPSSQVLATGAMLFSVAGTLLASAEPWPTIAGCVSVIGVSLVLDDDLRPYWFNWVAWVVSVPMVMLLAGRAGVPDDSVHLAALIWGGSMLLGGLIVDDALAGRRSAGTLIRFSWLWPPVVIGAVVTPLGLVPELSGPDLVVGLWALGATTFYLLVAVVARVGVVSLAGYGLASLAAVRLTGLSPREDTWMLVWVVASLVAISWALELIGDTGRDPWLRWDLPPLIAAHGVSLLALVYAFPYTVPETSVSFGVLSLVVSLWKRARVWAEVGNLLILVGAVAAGFGWFALALAGTSVRGIIGTWLSRNVTRFSYQVIGVLSAAFAWPSFLLWMGTDAVTAVGLTAIAFGSLAVLVAVARRFYWVEADTGLGWGALGAVGVVATALVAATDPELIAGPHLAIGLGLLATAIEIGLKPVDARYATLVAATSGLAWLALAPGLDWSMAETIRLTAYAFGVVAVLVAALSPWPRSGTSEAPAPAEPRAWMGLATTGVVAALIGNQFIGGEDLAVGVGAALVGVGFAASAGTLNVAWLRSASMAALIVAVNSLSTAFDVQTESLAMFLVLLAAGSTVASTSLWRRRPMSVWVTPWLVLAGLTNLQTLSMGATALPDSGLLVGVLFSVGLQSLAIGLIRDFLMPLLSAPVAMTLGFILLISDTVSGSAQWYTVPIGLALLSEVDLLRRWQRRRETDVADVQIMEWVGVGILVAPGLVEMFTTRLVFGLVPFLSSGLLLVWAIATRVRRRAVAAAAVAIATSVLVLFAAASDRAPDSASFWIVGFGAGFAVMLIAALVETYRTRRGKTMLRIHQLMDGWE